MCCVFMFSVLRTNKCTNRNNTLSIIVYLPRVFEYIGLFFIRKLKCSICRSRHRRQQSSSVFPLQKHTETATQKAPTGSTERTRNPATIVYYGLGVSVTAPGPPDLFEKQQQQDLFVLNRRLVRNPRCGRGSLTITDYRAKKTARKKLLNFVVFSVV